MQHLHSGYSTFKNKVRFLALCSKKFGDLWSKSNQYAHCPLSDTRLERLEDDASFRIGNLAFSRDMWLTTAAEFKQTCRLKVPEQESSWGSSFFRYNIGITNYPLNIKVNKFRHLCCSVAVNYMWHKENRLLLNTTRCFWWAFA